MSSKIETDYGLTEELKQLHAKWSKNPNWDTSGASYMISVHKHFRTDVQFMLDALVNGDIPAFHERFLGFDSFFEAHATIEDGSLFPFIRDELKMTKESTLLLGEHKGLVEILKTVAEDLAALKENNFKGPTFMIYTRMVEFEPLLFKHLSDEEKTVIDVILEHGWKGVVDDFVPTKTN